VHILGEAEGEVHAYACTVFVFLQLEQITFMHGPSHVDEHALLFTVGFFFLSLYCTSFPRREP